MANELNLSASLSFSKGGAVVDKALTATISVTGDAFSHEILSIAITTPTLLVESASLGTPGYVFIKNLDATNFVSVGITGSYTVKLKAGEFALFRYASTSLYAVADTAACLVEYIIIED